MLRLSNKLTDERRLMQIFNHYLYPLTSVALSFSGNSNHAQDMFPKDEHVLQNLHANPIALKNRIKTVKSNTFETARNQVYEDAKQGVLTQLAKGKQGVVILDVDDCTIDCLGYMEDSRYLQQDVNRFVNWVQDCRTAPAIKGAKDLIEWMNRLDDPNFKGYVFLTGRHEGVLSETTDDLDRLGLRGKNCLATILKPILPPDKRIPTAQFKTLERQKLIEVHGGILANLGDQLGDMTGSPEIDYMVPGAFKQKLSETIR